MDTDAGAFNGAPVEPFDLDASEIILLGIVFKRPDEKFRPASTSRSFCSFSMASCGF
jgi:hypothetical protein